MHIPVLAQRWINEMRFFFQPTDPLRLLDATFGRGGHSLLFLKNFPQGRVTAFDRDPDAIAYGRNLGDPRIQLHHAPFSHISTYCAQEEPYDLVLFDLGVSSPHMDQPDRGFSFQHEGPLDMRMDPSQGLTAEHMVNTLSEKELAHIFWTYGEEPLSRKIARTLVSYRDHRPITTTSALRDIVHKAVPYYRKRNTATLVFQALRIAVNDELGELNRALDVILRHMASKSALSIIAFHSLEDRISKLFFRAHKHVFTGGGTKKPIKPCVSEIAENPRARSACLRFGIRCD